MSGQNESYLQNLLGEQIWEGIRANEVAENYIQDLGTFGVERFVREPERITEEERLLKQRAQELAYENYTTFIQAANCSKDILKNFSNVEDTVDHLQEHLKLMNEQCHTFSKKAQELGGTRRMTSLTLSKHTQLLEILELPQLMDTCVRNNYWEDALELAAYVNRLERKLGYIPLVKNIAKDVQDCSRFMLVQLINQLRTNLALPQCLKLMGYLRRMGIFTEEELRLKFLQARDSWLNSTLETIPRDDALQHIMKTIEISRVNLFDIVTQYKASFNDEDPLLMAGDNGLNQTALFHGWIFQKVNKFLATLQADLESIPSNALESVLAQCMYFGLSLGRIGTDFRGLLTPIFAQVCLSRFQEHVKLVEAKFAETMSSFTFPKSVPPVTPSLQTEQLQPPYELLEFYPLAELCNGFIESFNQLRLCAPFTIAQPVTVSVQETLRRVAWTLHEYHRHEEPGFTPKEKEQFTKVCQLFAQELLHYLQNLLHAVFPPSQLALHAGNSASDSGIQRIPWIPREAIVEHIQHILPQLPSGRDDEKGSLARSTTNAQVLVNQSESLEASTENVTTKANGIDVLVDNEEIALNDYESNEALAAENRRLTGVSTE